MNWKIFLVPTLLFMLFSCKKPEKIEYNSDGTVSKKTIYTSPDRSSYRVIEYYDGKHIKGLYEFADGIKHGRSFNYYPKGSIESVFYYNMGRLTSIGRYYDEQGKLTDKGLFINDSLVVKEEYFYKDDLIKVNIFSSLGGEFTEAGSLLYNNMGLFGMDNSYYFIVNSADSVPAGDSIRVDVNFIVRSATPSHIALSLGPLNENLQFPYKERTYRSDSLSLFFYYKPKNKGYNLILGKLMYIKYSPKEQVDEFVFYHDFLAY